LDYFNNETVRLNLALLLAILQMLEYRIRFLYLRTNGNYNFEKALFLSKEDKYFSLILIFESTLVLESHYLGHHHVHVLTSILANSLFCCFCWKVGHYRTFFSFLSLCDFYMSHRHPLKIHCKMSQIKNNSIHFSKLAFLISLLVYLQNFVFVICVSPKTCIVKLH
jgi:hypothetical protein